MKYTIDIVELETGEVIRENFFRHNFNATNGIGEILWAVRGLLCERTWPTERFVLVANPI